MKLALHFTAGGYGIVYKCVDNDLEVAIKVLRECSNVEVGKVTRVSHF